MFGRGHKIRERYPGQPLAVRSAGLVENFLANPYSLQLDKHVLECPGSGGYSASQCI